MHASYFGEIAIQTACPAAPWQLNKQSNGEHLFNQNWLQENYLVTSHQGKDYFQLGP